jgi:hypothetical protein
MKYLKKFQTNTDYQTFKESSDWVTPNLSAIEENNSLFYNKTAIIFYTLETRYNQQTSHQALPGMTWDDWFNSEYYNESSDGHFRNSSDGKVVASDCEVKNSNGETVYLTDTIIPGEIYTYRGTK